jgi:hypothetical protein
MSAIRECRADEQATPVLLRTYWDISQRQAETSVVLAKAARSLAG